MVKRSILVVCTGNICRSPTAEAVMRKVAERRGLSAKVRIASAGTQDYHVGEPPDPRSVKHASRRGYDMTRQRAAQLARSDFNEFDYILAMDRGHLGLLKSMAPPNSKARLGLFLEASADWKDQDVPDPYYGGAASFEEVLDMVEDAAERWLDRIEVELDPSRVRQQRPR